MMRKHITKHAYHTEVVHKPMENGYNTNTKNATNYLRNININSASRSFYDNEQLKVMKFNRRNVKEALAVSLLL